MDDDDARTDALRTCAALLLARLDAERETAGSAIADLDLLIHDARAHAHRRARFNERDRDCYRLGAAFEPFSGLTLDDVQVTGFIGLGQTAILLLVREALANPALNIVELLHGIFRSPTGSAIRAEGVRVRWAWLQKLYREETDDFLRWPKGRDPKARWRAEKPTVNQLYLAGEIARLTQIVPPRFANRGAAFEWIYAAGGNPRFQQSPQVAGASPIEAASR